MWQQVCYKDKGLYYVKQVAVSKLDASLAKGIVK